MKTSQNSDVIRMDWRLKLAIRAGRFSRRFERLPYKFQRFIQVLTNNIALGILSRDGINEMVKYNYSEENPNHYNPENYDYQWEQAIVDPLHDKTRKKDLLVAFCGQGREAKIFSKAGFEVTGIDRVPFMIEGAQENAKTNDFDASFYCEDFNTYTADTPFSIVYTSTWMFTTYPGKKARRRFLEKCKEICSSDGLIIISYRLRDNKLSDRLGYLLAKTVALVTNSKSQMEEGDRVENLLFWKCFAKEEIEEELKEAGLRTCFHHSIKDGLIQWKFLERVR